MRHRTARSRVAVVVPAHQEAATLDRCLRALRATGRRVGLRHPGVQVQLLVVLDRCTDGSERVLSRYPDVDRLAVSIGRVGAVRAAGMAHARASALAAGLAPERLWYAWTDADSVVPAGWLTAQLRARSAGADLFAGTVRPLLDSWTLDPRVLQEWRAGYQEGDGHPHAHGANLGVRADVLDRLGGLPGLSVGEDRWLVDAVDAAGGRVHRSGYGVLTSARTTPRCTDGVGRDLAQIADRVGLRLAG